MKRKILQWYLIISMVLVVFMSLLFIYWSFIDGVMINKVANTNHITYKTDKEVYYPGDTIFISVKGFCKYRELPVKSYYSLIDGISIPYAVKDRAIPKGCVDENRYYLLDTIPNIGLPDGDYYISGYHQYNINPIRTGDEGIQINFETNKFRISSHKIIN